MLHLSYLENVILIAYLDGCGKFYYPEDSSNPFSTLANSLCVAFMAKGGDESKQFVELMKQTPSLADLQTMGAPPGRSLTDKLLRRKEPEK